jgi:hypothetical protein
MKSFAAELKRKLQQDWSSHSVISSVNAEFLKEAKLQSNTLDKHTQIRLLLALAVLDAAKINDLKLPIEELLDAFSDVHAEEQEWVTGIAACVRARINVITEEPPTPHGSKDSAPTLPILAAIKLAQNAYVVQKNKRKYSSSSELDFLDTRTLPNQLQYLYSSFFSESEAAALLVSNNSETASFTVPEPPDFISRHKVVSESRPQQRPISMVQLSGSGSSNTVSRMPPATSSSFMNLSRPKLAASAPARTKIADFDLLQQSVVPSIANSKMKAAKNK